MNLNGSSSSDPDGDALTYRWTAPAAIALSGATTATPSFTAPDVASDTPYTITLNVTDGQLWDTDTVTVTVREVNRAPAANAGADQAVDERTTVNLNGTGSSDPDNDGLTYSWTSSPAIPALQTSSSATPSFTAPDVASDTPYTITLNVTDGTLHDTDTVTITVRHVNRAPAAEAGADQSASERATVNLNGSSSSDPDGDALTYRWTAPAAIALSGATTATPSFTAPDVASDTPYTITLNVTDGQLWDTDTVTVTVREVNRAPAANAGADQAVDERATVNLNGTGSSDPDNDGLTYSWTSSPAIPALQTSSSATPSFTAPDVASDTPYTITLNVTDGTLHDTDTVTITVRHVNRAPAAEAGADQSASERATVNLNGSSSSDPDGDALTYRWTAPAAIALSGATTATPSFTAPDVASDTPYTITLNVTDGQLWDTDTVTVTVREVNRAPAANAGADQAVDERTTVNLNGTGSSDPDNDGLTYSWTSSPAIPALQTSSSATPSFTAPDVASDTPYTITLNVTDGTLHDTDTVTITVRHVNRAPAAEAGADQSASERATVNLNGSSSSDPDGDALTYRWTAPAAIALSGATTATPSFTAPDVASDTPYTITLNVTDGQLWDTDTVTVTVREVNRAPAANAGADQAVDERATVNLNGTGSSDPDNDGLTYSWTSSPAIPALQTSSSATPSFTAPDVASDTPYTITLNVTDGTLHDTDTVTITVRHVNRAPAAEAGADQSASERATVNLNGSSSSDPDGDALTYRWTAPAAIALSGATTATPSFTAPDVASDTPYTITLNVTDGQLWDTDTVTVTVREVNRAPAANAGADQAVDERTTVNLNGTGSSDPDNDGLTYSWTSSPAIPALQTSSSATPSFTAPDVASDTPYTITLNVTDGTLHDTDTVTITVRHVNRAPAAEAGADQSASERATVNLNGSSSSDPDGDALTYRWTAPAAIALSGATTATPSFTAPDVASDTPYTITLNVTDGQLWDTDTVTVTVREVNRAPAANAGADQAVDERATVNLNGTGSSDPDNDGLTYSWTSSPAIPALQTSSSATPSFTAPDVASDTPYTITLNVTDGTLHDTDTVTITVRHVNRAPAAEAGADQSVDEGYTVRLDGSNSSDPDNDAITYAWTAPSGITLQNAATATPSFEAPQVSADTQYNFTLTVSDGRLSATATATVTVQDTPVRMPAPTPPPPNSPPSADAGPDQTVDEDDAVTLDGSGSSDPDGSIVSYTWAAPQGVTLQNDNTAVPTFTAPSVSADTGYTFALTVTDDDGATDADTVTVIVRDVPPTLAAPKVCR